jgi:DNA helicase HerA-like ATPase
VKPTDNILVMGRRGCGKSHLAKQIQKKFPRRIIIDTLNEYRNEGELFSNFSDFSKKLIQLKREKSKKFVLVYQASVESEDFEAEFNEILRISYYFGNIQIVIEEIQMHCHTGWIPSWLKKNLLIGRHQGISLLFTSQRPGEVHKTIVSQCHHIFCGKLIDSNDIKYVSNFLNQDSQKLISLPDRKFIYFDGINIREISNDFKA